jgi:hypothetical protein
MKRGIVGVAAGGDLHEFAMEMDDVGAACALVQVVDVLGDDGDLEIVLEERQFQQMTFVGLGRRRDACAGRCRSW